ncbi:MAG: uroporphyrinogen decarboxylase family protein [Paludibacter sp.]
MNQSYNDYFAQFAQRNQQIEEKIANVYRHKNTTIPKIVYNMNYWMDGENPELVPADYFDNPAVMTQFQLDKMKQHMENFEDDFIPFLFPWYGTGVIPSAMGCEIIFHPNQDPATGKPVINDVSEIAALKKPDYYKDGLMPKVLETIDFMRWNTNLPISVTDPQGPLNIALSICGVENLFIWMCMYPEEVHQLMDFCADVLIEWITIQKKHAGQELNSGAWPRGIILPKGFGGVWIADDDCTQISAEQYSEFVVPYNSKVLKAFGGGTIHFCGSARHQINNFLETEGLTGINNFCMGDFDQIKEMQEKFEDKLAVMVCDFNPLNAKEYYTQLFHVLKQKSTILSSYVSYGYALDNERYAITTRDVNKIAHEIAELFAESEM